MSKLYRFNVFRPCLHLLHSLVRSKTDFGKHNSMVGVLFHAGSKFLTWRHGTIVGFEEWCTQPEVTGAGVTLAIPWSSHGARVASPESVECCGAAVDVHLATLFRQAPSARHSRSPAARRSTPTCGETLGSLAAVSGATRTVSTYAGGSRRCVRSTNHNRPNGARTTLCLRRSLRCCAPGRRQRIEPLVFECSELH